MSASVYFDFSVSFICDYMVVVVSAAVVALDDDPDDESVQNQAVELADKIALDQYGFSPLSVCNETVVECCGVTR